MEKKFYAVVGIGFGDEGKGITTDYLCSFLSNPIVVRYSGGQQAGHTVKYNGVKHVFSNFGSGTLRGVPTYWSRFCTVDPIGLINEYEILQNKGVSPVLFIDKNSPVTTPYDMFFNEKTEEINQHGSCGLGVGSTIQREENRYSLKFGDIVGSKSILDIKMELIKKYYNFEENISLKRFFKSIEEIRNSDNITLVDGLPLCFNHVIFEGSQGLLLDQNIGFFPHVTRTNTGSKNIVEICKESIGYVPKINYFLITRAYQTRHGNGPMTNDATPNNIYINPDETNVKNKFQGEFRRSILDVDLLKYGIECDGVINNTKYKSLVITCVDHIENDCRFVYNGKIDHSIDTSVFIGKISDILKIPTVYVSKSDESKNIENLAYEYLEE
jgi:adenylosuccinate synthase